MAKPNDYGCSDAIKDINTFFEIKEINMEKMEALDRMLDHMTKGSTLGHHNISCQPCWDYYTEMKRKKCGG
ncbi:MAG TPA: hypothetical protein DIC35_03745 [Candidatus Moranbacteria bacterium]|nr:hypothetical protein [Candidatus Moranbacteria bacterium]